MSEICGSGFPYIANHRAPEATRGWGSTDSANFTGIWGRSSVNPGSNNSTGSWGRSSTNSIVNWGSSVKYSYDNSPRSPVCPCVFSNPRL